MSFDWAAVNRFILICFGVILISYLVRQSLIGGQVGGIDVAIAIAVATVVTGSVTKRRSHRG